MVDFPRGGDKRDWPGQAARLIGEARAGSAAAAGSLLGWLKDMNWPGAREAADFLSRNPEPVVSAIVEILRGDDDLWKLHAIECVLLAARPGQLAPFVPQLIRLSRLIDPEGVSIQAAWVLCQHHLCSREALAETVERLERGYADRAEDLRELRRALG